MNRKECRSSNPFAARLEGFSSRLRRRSICCALVFGETNQKGLVGFGCDNGLLVVCAEAAGRPLFFTDFRYIPAARRQAPWLIVRDIARLDLARVVPGGCGAVRVGFEGTVCASRYLELQKALGERVRLVDVNRDILLLRAEKTPQEIARIAAAEALNDRIWNQARSEFKPGMTEKDMQRIIRAWMNALGDGEAFETIVCVGANAAECHHVPDATVWNGVEPLLVDMGVRLDGYCSDMTRCLPSAEGGARERLYRKIYGIALSANRAAIGALRPGITGRQLDAVARRHIAKAGYGKCFGHALGHGVGLDIHEMPAASRKSDVKFRPGMIVTIEPGIYIEGILGVRIEDLALVTRDGCEVLSSSAK